MWLTMMQRWYEESPNNDAAYVVVDKLMFESNADIPIKINPLLHSYTCNSEVFIVNLCLNTCGAPTFCLCYAAVIKL